MCLYLSDPFKLLLWLGPWLLDSFTNHLGIGYSPSLVSRPATAGLCTYRRGRDYEAVFALALALSSQLHSWGLAVAMDCFGSSGDRA